MKSFSTLFLKTLLLKKIVVRYILCLGKNFVDLHLNISVSICLINITSLTG